MIDILRTSSASEAPGYPNFVGWKTVNGKRVPIFRYFNVNKAHQRGGDRSEVPLATSGS
jgi:outer membrane receptor for ferrienterochelin and colicins